MASADDYLEGLVTRIVDERIEERLQREKEVGLSVPEAANVIGISTSSAWRMVRRGELKTVRVVGRVLVPQSEIGRLFGDHSQG